MRISLIVVSVVLFISFVLQPVSAQQQRAYFVEQQPLTAVWSAREKANVEFITRTSSFRDGLRNNGAATSLTNYFILYGGQTDQGPANDVWASTNGRAWMWVAGVADGEEHPAYPDTFNPVSDAAHCQDTQFRQFRAGGRRGGPLFNDVWMSTNGYVWTEQTAAAEFDPVYLASMTSDTNNILYIAGGILNDGVNPRTSSGAVWMSTNQGRVWRSMANYVDADGASFGPGARAVSMLLSTPRNELIWMTGVNTGTFTNNPLSYRADVWVSSNQGRSFDVVSRESPFGRRDDANAEISAGGLMVLAGGYAGTNAAAAGEILNDVWISANGGYSWGLCVKDAEWEDRRYQMTLLDASGYLWVMGGNNNGQRYQDVWRSTWSFSNNADTASRCQVTIPSCGTGLRCMPNSGSTLITTNSSAVYCDACPNPAAGSTVAATSTLTVALTVCAVAAALCLLALLYSCYRLRAAGVASPIPLPAAAQQWWSKSATNGGEMGGAAPVNGGSTATNGDGLYQPLRIRDQI